VVVPDLVGTPWAYGALMARWGRVSDWAQLALVWLMTITIGVAIYFFPITRLLDSLVE